MIARTRWAAVLSVVACGVSLSACAVDEEPATEPAPVLGWVVGDGCATPADRVRSDADGIVDRRIAEAGYRSLYVVCDEAQPPAALAGPVLGEGLGSQDLDLSVVPSSDADVRAAIRADLPLPALRTAITRQVMGAQPLVFDGDVALLDDDHVATVANRDVLDIARDGRRTAGAPIQGDAERQSRAVGSQGLVVSLTNSASSARDMSFDLDEVNLIGDDTVAATDVWTGRRITASSGTITVSVGSTDSALLRIG